MNDKLLTAISALLLICGVGLATAGSTVELIGVAERDSVVEKYDINQEFEEFLFNAEVIAKNELSLGKITKKDYFELVSELSKMTIDEFVLTKSMINSEAKKTYKDGKDMSVAGENAIIAGVFPLALGAGLLFATSSSEIEKKSSKTSSKALLEEKQLD